jgi:hypothetical protein
MAMIRDGFIAKNVKALIRHFKKYPKTVKKLTNTSVFNNSWSVILVANKIIFYFTSGYFNRGIK